MPAAALQDPDNRPVRFHQKYVASDALGAKITELHAHITAATCRFLELVAEFDEKGYWELPGLCSCAHWLNWQCGIGMNAAREKVRVARALKGLPKISQAFARGEISYSKIRAITRVAKPENEDYLLMFARHGTAYHVEKLIAGFRRVTRLEAAAADKQPQALREVRSRWDEDGCLVVTARLPAEQGAVLLKALELAVDRAGNREYEAARSTADRVNEPTDVSAETPLEEKAPVAARRADALAELAEHYLNGEAPTGAAGDRYQVVVHVSAETRSLSGPERPRVGDVNRISAASPELKNADPPQPDSDPDVSAAMSAVNDLDLPRLGAGPGVSAETLFAEDPDPSRPGMSPGVSAGSSAIEDLDLPREDGDPGVSAETSPVKDLDLPRLDSGPGVSAETSRRLGCDCSIVPIFKGIKGEPLSVGRKTRAIPPPVMRALRVRDAGCRFPGCTNSRFVDGHHIEHWADGGETSLENLVLLCRRHHRLVHEGGFGCERSRYGGVIFKSPRGNVIPAAFEMTAPLSVNEPVAWIAEQVDCRHIDSTTCVTKWAGERCDWDLAVGHLFVDDDPRQYATVQVPIGQDRWIDSR